MTNETKQEFETLSKNLMKWLNESCHPHNTILITPTTAELLEGQMVVNTDEFIID